MRKPGKHYRQVSRRGQMVLAIVLAVSAFIIGFVVWWFIVNTDMQNTAQPVNEPPAEVVEVQEEVVEQEEEVLQDVFDAEVIKKVVETWVASTPGQASVVVTDINGAVLGSVEPDRQYFAASIYKLFVAYEGYKQLDAGTTKPEELYINGQTRLECLFLMINESDSPCAEKLWAELGKETVTAQLKEYGITNTSMTALRTTAFDAAVMLSRIARGEGLSEDSQKRFLASMETQIYRDALNEGFSENIVVYNKIGFNEKVEYHDTAIVKFADGRQLIVSVLTERVGTKNIAKLAEALETAL